MAEYRFKPLTADNAFDFSEVLTVIGVEQALKAFDIKEIRTIMEDKTKNTKQIGLVMGVKIVGILIGNLSKARNEIYRFFAGCMEWDNGSVVTVEDLKNMPLKQFIKLIKDFAKQDDLADFFGDVAELADMEQNDSQNAVTEDTATQRNIYPVSFTVASSTVQ